MQNLPSRGDVFGICTAFRNRFFGRLKTRNFSQTPITKTNFLESIDKSAPKEEVPLPLQEVLKSKVPELSNLDLEIHPPKSREEVTETFNEHPLFFLCRCGVTLIIGLPFFLLFFFLPSKLIPTELFIWSVATLLLITASFLVQFYLSWNLNIVFFTKQEVGRVDYRGIFNFGLNRFRLDRIKSIDLEQRGFWQTILNSGDIHITSEMGSNEDIVLRNIWPVRKAFRTLRRKILNFMRI
ncbi:PH domain-containing protein [Candidatus Peregrinibacteria bacterium]|nr:PH domain-containing protein [Candidatus Peregrinibacteria bacterium]